MLAKDSNPLRMKIHLLLVSILFLTSTACNKEDSISTTSDLVFSESPFPLNGIDAKFSKEIAYDSKSRTQFDIWLPDSDASTGLVIYTHGGGFSSGDKDFVYSAQQGGAWDFPADIRFLLQNNIAFATIRYTLLSTTGEQDGIKKPMTDVKRALQYIRHHASDFNIDKDNIILAGNSAGGGTSLWIAFNNELADAQNSDPVLRESTRVKGVAAREPQASYNIEERWVNDVFIDYNLTWAEILTNEMGNLSKIYGVSSTIEYESPAIDTYRAEVDMLTLLTADDPAIWIDNTLRDVVPPYSAPEISSHHAFHARELKQKADAVGVENIIYYGKNPVIYAHPSNESWTQFCKRILSQ